MQAVLLVVHLLIALALIGLILLQRSEGGALGIGGGGNSGGSIFSARGVGNTLTRATAILAVAFFATSIGLTMLSTHGSKPASVFTEQPAAPANSGEVQLPKLGQDAPAQQPAQQPAPAGN